MEQRPNGTHFLSRTYSLGHKLGDGAFSVVRLGSHRATGQQVAIKCVRKQKLSDADRENLFREVDIMKALKHPYIIQFVEFIDDPDCYYVVLEYLAGGELFDRITEKEYYTEDLARDCVRIICAGLQFIHAHDIVHRDIKPENLILNSIYDDASLKIADFGLAAKLSPDRAALKDPCGTPGYAAPEIVRGNYYSKPVDMWALGVVTYCMLGGYPPFEGADIDELFENILRGDYSYHDEYWTSVSVEAKDFIRRLLCINPLARLTADQALQHPWVTADKDALISHNLTDNLELLRKYQSVLKFKATATAMVAAQRFKMALKRHKRPHKLQPFHTQGRDMHVLGKSCSSPHISPLSTERKLMIGLSKAPSGHLRGEGDDGEAGGVDDSLRMEKRHSSRRILYQPSVLATDSNYGDDRPRLVKRGSSKKAVLPSLLHPTIDNAACTLDNPLETHTKKKSMRNIGDYTESSDADSSAFSKHVDSSQMEPVPSGVNTVHLTLESSLLPAGKSSNDLKGRYIVEEVVEGPFGNITRIRSKSNVLSGSRLVPPLSPNSTGADRLHIKPKKTEQKNRRHRSVGGVILPKIDHADRRPRRIGRSQR